MIHTSLFWCRFCTSESGNGETFEPLASQTSCSYKVRLEDVGRCLRCECIVTDVFGRSTKPVYAETAPVLPGLLNFLQNFGLGYFLNSSQCCHYVFLSISHVYLQYFLIRCSSFHYLSLVFCILLQVFLE